MLLLHFVINITIFLPACLPSLIMCNCFAPSSYLILELLIGVHYDYLFPLSEIYCSTSIHFVKGSKMMQQTPLLREHALQIKRKT